MSFQLTSAPGQQWYHYKHYRGPEGQKVQLFYSKTKEKSEEYAKLFLKEPLVGFDMEWRTFGCHRLQDHVSLIQVASEDKIALFHIGLHSGNTTDDLIAPSLRTLIESATITKAGVNIVGADFTRLDRHFGLKPKASFELSHLYRLVRYAGSHLSDMEDSSHRLRDVTTKVVAMDEQVQRYLGRPLKKGTERKSDWSKELGEAQRDYAATDAYAGFMLYHRMNAKRLSMDPIPPLPVLGHPKIPTRKLFGLTPILLRSEDPRRQYITIAEFYPANESTDEDENEDDEEDDEEKETTTYTPQKGNGTGVVRPLDGTPKTAEALYKQLAAKRESIAHKTNKQVYQIAPDVALQNIARQRVVELDKLLQVPGIGQHVQKKYGADLIEVVAEFLQRNQVALHPPTKSGLAHPSAPVPRITSALPKTPARAPRRRKIEAAPDGDDSGDSSPAFDDPLDRTPQLHTGLSFSMANTGIGNVEGSSYSDTSQESVYATPPERPSANRKRKRTASPERKCTPASALKAPPVPLDSPESRIFKSRLSALSRRVSAHVSDQTLEEIVRLQPRTQKELEKIPGIRMFLNACADKELDLLRNIAKWAPVRS
ncbi:ribonuclease H-like protein [Corynespora cassiicola Philippines]|uniref:Ribonuclease H-like protein n=1 Tax=Corynespora cassiicola Philippines TaxID=1448308 RepID=A0A2T2PA11_CORCC|nr:ribonuclease H-like protein [Corynespora cassiicola Philippines]